eukprot:11271250-Ditylum_brightwellii.AAC.2
MIKAGVDELGKKPIPVAEHYLQQIAIDAFMKELGLQQFNSASDQVTAKLCLDAFWEKAASVRIIHNGHCLLYTSDAADELDGVDL